MPFVACLVAFAAPAAATVLEIGDDGAVRVREGAGDVRWIEPSSADDSVAELPEVPLAAVTEIAAPAAPAAWAASLARAADAYHVSPTLLAALVRQESGWRADAVSAKGAMGLAQLMPGTARALAVDPRDPAANLVGGARYLRQMLDMFDGDVERALAAYNAGPGRVLRAGGVPRIAETRAYVSAIIDRMTPAEAAAQAAAQTSPAPPAIRPAVLTIDTTEGPFLP